jgi:hypothetical protein
MSSNNRQQLATGLKALLGGAAGASASRVELPSPVADAAPELHPVPEVADEASLAPMPELKAVPEARADVAVEVDPSSRKPKRRAEPVPAPKAEPGPEAIPAMNTTSRVGTLERPYLRQRDNQPTRKVGVVLPVDLSDRLQIHCVKARIRPNAFIERAILDALERLS